MKPPADPDHPKWENLSSNVGAQYFWIDRIFYWQIGSATPDSSPSAHDHNFVYQLFHTSRPDRSIRRLFPAITSITRER